MIQTHFGPDFKPIGPKFNRESFFPKIWLRQSLDIMVSYHHGQLSSCTISEKTDDPILRKLSDVGTDRQTEGQTDESDSIGRRPTNVERPK